MSDKIEGTFHLEGLIEGPVQEAADFEGNLRDWVGLCSEVGIGMSLEIDGGHFSLLAEDRTVDARGAGGAAGASGGLPERIADALGQLIAVFDEHVRGEVFSTLRSVEYRKGEEVQTVYAFAPDGSVDTQTRVVPTETVAPQQPLTRSERIKIGLLGGVVGALVIVVVVLLFGRGIASAIRDAATPLSAERIAVDAGAFEKYFTVAEKKIDRRVREGPVLVVTVKRSELYPKTDAEVESALRKAGSERERLALESIARSYVRCEFFDAKGRFLYERTVRIRGLVEKDEKSGKLRESVELVLPVGGHPRPERIVIICQ